MKVLHFFKTYWPDTFGGVERTIHAIARSTARHGIDTEVLSLSRTPDEATRPLDGHLATKARLDFELASTGFSRQVFRKFRALSAKADLIHYHFPWPLMDVVHFQSRHGKPTLVTYHSDIVKQRLILPFYRPLMMRFLGDVDAIVPTSPDYLQSSPVLGAFRAKSTVIPIGIDEGTYPSPTEADNDWCRSTIPEPFVLFVGVLRYYKGLDVLIQAAEQVRCKIVIAGSGPIENQLKLQADTLRRDNVIFLGEVTEPRKMALLDNCLGFVFPSNQRSEAYGLSLVEAAMCGKPMISCEIGTGTSYVNEAGTTGLVVPPSDPQRLAEAINRLIASPTEAAGWGRAARDRYVRLFTADRMGKSYAELYRRLAGRAR
ncbi:glycosyltransferase [Mesorhizobium abyssinicae]|uniref:glycosyltransferase n=1 Tax=Mesorhizobium TaxID=68287 RepID=UPI000FE46B06|nr:MULTISPECIES: glycosyltransferase [Mesorhizobium]MDX8436158.1 glycosyltransferase [Mesorhizobium abyssinicae]RWC97178.1 MAG: glycosyltransferase [Mesorhizobium sp.]RWF26875.1 MAG: glycosyltransferase [Mesorhizobium sp.]TJW01924.1 MAG: glycosyltransferase [Mesorhizobium sp.]